MWLRTWPRGNTKKLVKQDIISHPVWTAFVSVQLRILGDLYSSSREHLGCGVWVCALETRTEHWGLGLGCVYTMRLGLNIGVRVWAVYTMRQGRTSGLGFGLCTQ